MNFPLIHNGFTQEISLLCGWYLRCYWGFLSALFLDVMLISL